MVSVMREDCTGALVGTTEEGLQDCSQGKAMASGGQVGKGPEVCLVHPEKGEEAGAAETDRQGRRSEKGQEVRGRQRAMQGL